MCDYTLCKVTSGESPNMSCVWCNRIFHKQCLLQNRFNPEILFEPTYSIQCNFCNPSIPFQMFEYPSDDIITVINYGEYIDSNLEINKANSERDYIYPIGFKSSRMFPSYKTNRMTKVTCEILCVDECVFENDTMGTKDVYLFKVIYEDDPDNPVTVLNSLRYLALKINERYSSRKIGSGVKMFGLNQEYIQYLILLHVPNAQDISTTCTDKLIQTISDNNQLDRCVNYENTLKSSKEIKPFLYTVNKIPNIVSFDPQKQLFYF